MVVKFAELAGTSIFKYISSLAVGFLGGGVIVLSAPYI